MKKNLLLLAFTLVLSTVGFANGTVDQKRFDATLDQQVRVEVRQLQELLRFNEFEYIQIKKLTGAELADLQAAKQTYTDAAELHIQLQQIKDAYTAKVSALLNDSQKKAFSAYLAATQANLLAIQ
ncbi:hypothetical protein [Adhaeribacter aquaticus]|uniref:hypothetical protein n=1 Tax=Adhaeribacter aquaticus TaxID=299567 RepID=UPI00041484B1|nr:hypothetical protein [Adhaeribacter aquaticus]